MIAPERIYALGLTYRDHLRETGERAGPPAVFLRDPASIVAPGGPVRIPSRAQMIAALERLEPGLGARVPALPALLDYEVELAIVLRDDVPAARLDDPRARLPLGYFVACDVTARSVQILGEGVANRLDFWSAAKSFPSTLLIGAEVVTPADDVCPQVPLTTTVRGQRRQHSSTAELLWSPRELLRFAVGATGASGLRAGDVVLTGTPGGVALAVPRWKRWIADRVLDRFGKLRAAARLPGFLAAGDELAIDGGPLGGARAIVEAAP